MNVPEPYCSNTFKRKQFVMSEFKAIFEITRIGYPLGDLKRMFKNMHVSPISW